MKDTNQRLFLAIAIWLACIFGYFTFFAPKKPAQPVTPPAAASPPSTTAPATPPSAAAAAARPSDVPRGTSAPTREVVFQTSRARFIVTSEGAALRSVELLGDKWTRHKGRKEESHVDLVQPHAGEALPFSTTLRDAAGVELLAANEPFELLRQDARSATFRSERGGVTLTKTLAVSADSGCPGAPGGLRSIGSGRLCS